MKESNLDNRYAVRLRLRATRCLWVQASVLMMAGSFFSLKRTGCLRLAHTYAASAVTLGTIVQLCQRWGQRDYSMPGRDARPSCL